MPSHSISASPPAPVVLVIFHNDLRIDDNATLHKAVALATGHDPSCNDGKLLLVYATALKPAASTQSTKSNRLRHAQKTNSAHSQAYHYTKMGKARQRFLYESLADLNHSVTQRGNALVFLENTALAYRQLCELIVNHQVTHICVSKTADYQQNTAYKALQRAFAHVKWHTSSTATLYDALPTAELPPIFSQFRKQVEYHHDLLNASADIALYDAPSTLPPPPSSLRHSPLLFSHSTTVPYTPAEAAKVYDHFIGGESYARNHVTDYFNSQAPSTYKTTRNALDNWSHSTKFSPWLANGTLSVHRLLNRLRHYQQHVIANDSTYWIWFELLWREYFYWYACKHQHKLFVFQGIHHKKPLTSFYAERFERWKHGNTPYAIVNACMNQLHSTGYMSNRGRQLVASCFIHELGLDWRYGATYFEQHLIDYDVASNWGNWQYLAGVGADPRGCRQFNLKKQTQQYDPTGAFIERWHGDVGMNNTALIDSQDMTGWPIGYDK